MVKSLMIKSVMIKSVMTKSASKARERQIEMAAGVETVTRNSAVKGQARKKLAIHFEQVRELHLRQLFADDPKRGARFTTEALKLYLDYSKNRITDETLKLLVQLAQESGLRERIDAMFRGDKINLSPQADFCIAAVSHCSEDVDIDALLQKSDRCGMAEDMTETPLYFFSGVEQRKLEVCRLTIL
jgi:phosphoglucose isomerase-like protein